MLRTCTICFFLIGIIGGCDVAVVQDGLVVLGSAEKNFGERREGEVLSHTFILVNQCREPITIVDLAKSCSCVVADLSSKSARLAQGETFDLPLKISARPGEDAVSGAVILTYRRDNSPTTEKLRLRTTATVMQDFLVTPKELDFGCVDGLQSRVTRSVALVPNVDEDLVIKAVRSDSSFLTATLRPETEEQAARTIDVRFDAAEFRTSQSVSGTVIVSTSSQRVPELVVNIKAEYQAAAESKPHSVVIGSDEHGEVREAIRIRTAFPSRIMEMKSSDAVSKIQMQSRGTGVSNEHEIDLLVPPAEVAINETLAFSLELLTQQDETVECQVRVPIHRFIERKKP